MRVILVLAVMGLATVAQAAEFELNFDRLTPGIEALNCEDHDIVDDTINLIKQGDHALALTRLSSLKQRSPENSSLRILASYALLEAGNLVGAFQEAEQAHLAPNGNSYRCWFLAKIALLNGKRELCERELRHVKSAGDMVAEAKELERELAKN